MQTYRFIPVLNRCLDKIIEDYKLPINTEIYLIIDTHDLDLRGVLGQLNIHTSHPDNYNLVKSTFKLTHKGDYLLIGENSDGPTFNIDGLASHIKPANSHVLVRYEEPISVVCRKYLYIEFSSDGGIKRMLTSTKFFTERNHFKNLLGEYGVNLGKDGPRYRIITKVKKRISRTDNAIYHPSMGKIPLFNYTIGMYKL